MRFKKSKATCLCLAISLSVVCGNIAPAFAEAVSNERTSETTTINTEKTDDENTKAELIKNEENAQKEYDSAKKKGQSFFSWD